MNTNDNVEVLVDILIIIKGKNNQKALDNITKVEALVDNIIGIKHNINKNDIISYFGAGIFLIGYALLLIAITFNFLVIGLMALGTIIMCVMKMIKYPSVNCK